MPNEALFTQSGTYDAAELRKLIRGLWSSPAPGGVIDGLVVTVGGALTISVSAGFAKIDDGTSGSYLAYSTSTSTVTLSSNSGGGATRTDTIYAKVNDPGAGGTAGEMVVDVATGTSTIPALAVPLGTVTVTTGNVLTVASGARAVAEPRSPSAQGSYASLAERLAAIEANLAATGGAAVTVTGVQTLTNKDMTSPTNTFPTGVVLPPGMVVPYAGSTAPSGWLLCAGQTISRTGANAALFAAIGTAFGAGDGSTTFTLPDLRGRIIAGPDAMGGTAASRLTGLVLAGSRGAQTTSLDVSQLPAHTHSATADTDYPDHAHSIAAHSHGGATAAAAIPHTHTVPFQFKGDTAATGNAGRVTDIQSQTGGGGNNNNATTSQPSGGTHAHGIPAEALASGGASARHSHAVTVGSTGSGAPVPTVQPTLGMNYIVKL